MPAYVIRRPYRGIDVWVSSSICTAASNGFDDTAYETAFLANLGKMEAPIDRVEVHTGALLFVFVRDSLCRSVVIPVGDPAPTSWSRLVRDGGV